MSNWDFLLLVGNLDKLLSQLRRRRLSHTAIYRLAIRSPR
jgi:hypothetical protein